MNTSQVLKSTKCAIGPDGDALVEMHIPVNRKVFIYSGEYPVGVDISEIVSDISMAYILVKWTCLGTKDRISDEITREGALCGEVSKGLMSAGFSHWASHNIKPFATIDEGTLFTAEDVITEMYAAHGYELTFIDDR